MNEIESRKAAAKHVAETIIQQMGGQGRLKAMVAAHNFGFEAVQQGSMSFKFKGSRKAKYVNITLTNMDTYTVKFWKVKGAPMFETTMVKEFENVYCDQLIEIFESFTGLYLSF